MSRLVPLLTWAVTGCQPGALICPCPRSPRLAAPPSGLRGPGFLPGLCLWISCHTPPSRRPASSRRRGGELMGSLQARPLRSGGDSVLGPAQEPGQPLGVKAETEGGTHADHLPSAWPCVLPSVRVEGLLPLTASCAPTAFTCPKRNWGRTQEAGGLVDRGLWTASLRAFPLSLTGQQVCVTFPCLSFPLWGDLHRGTDTAAQCRTRPHWPAAVGGHHGPPHRGGVGSAEAPVVGSLI